MLPQAFIYSFDIFWHKIYVSMILITFFLMKNHISVPYVTVCQHYSQIMSNYDNICSYPGIKLITRFLFEL